MLTSLCCTWPDRITVQTFGTAPKKKKKQLPASCPRKSLTYAKTYQYRSRFDKVIRKIMWCSFFAPHGILCRNVEFVSWCTSTCMVIEARRCSASQLPSFLVVIRPPDVSREGLKFYQWTFFFLFINPPCSTAVRRFGRIRKASTIGKNVLNRR